MSKVVIQGHASGTGDFTIAAPNSDTDRTLTLPDAGGTLDRLDRTGNVLQVVQTVKTDTFSVTGTTWTDVTGLSVNITPSSSSNKILMLADVSVGTSTFAAYIKFKRDSTDIYLPDVAGSRPRIQGRGGHSPGSGDAYGLNKISVMYLDSPSTTSQITYKMQLRTYAASSVTSYINRTHGDRDNANYDPRSVSSVTVMEIAA
mgnify:CR=1 FL=1|jgi:hypothetical protein